MRTRSAVQRTFDGRCATEPLMLFAQNQPSAAVCAEAAFSSCLHGSSLQQLFARKQPTAAVCTEAAYSSFKDKQQHQT